MPTYTLPKSEIKSVKYDQKMTLTFINFHEDENDNSSNWLHTPTLAVQDEKLISKNLKAGQSMPLEAGMTYKIKAGFADCEFEIKPVKAADKKGQP